MLYFTAKDDCGYIEAQLVFQKTYLDGYYASVNFVQQNQLWIVPIDRLSTQRQMEAESIAQTYHSKRNFVTSSLPRMAQIADRYESPDLTSYLLSTTEMPDYNGNRPRFFVGEDFNVWNDGMQRLLGAVQLRKVEEWRKIRNPINWPALVVSMLLYLPVSIVKSFGIKTGKFWDTFTDMTAKVIVMAIILFVGYYYFGVTKPEIKSTILKYIGAAGDQKEEGKKDRKAAETTGKQLEIPTRGR
jgi:hypothetical protein